MANAIDLALRKIYISIPKQILEFAFQKEPDERSKSLDECIVSKVIEGFVRPDLNSISGKYKEIALDPAWCVETYVPSSYVSAIPLIPYAVYHVPNHARENRNISQVLCVKSPYMGLGSIGSFSSAVGTPGLSLNAGNIACSILDNMTGAKTPVLPNPILLQGNKIKLTPMEMSMMTMFPWILQCRLEFDIDFMNMTPDALSSFCELVLAATKSYIYNNTVIEMDMGVVHSGQNIGMFREIITEYKDQFERYEVLRNDFHSASNYLDQETMREIMLMSLGL